MGNVNCFIRHENSRHPVVIYSKSDCEPCHRTKKIFDKLQAEMSGEGKTLDVKIFNLDQMGLRGKEIHQELFKLTGQRTVPNVFINNQHVGGWVDTVAIETSGRLKDMVDSKRRFF